MGNFHRCVLIVEGPLTAGLADWLMVEGYDVVVARLEEVIRGLQHRPCGGVIVDVWAPGMGITPYQELLAAVRVPLFLVLPPLSPQHRVTFVPLAAPHGRFISLLRALHERLQRADASAGDITHRRVRVGDVEIDLARWQVLRGKREIPLTPTEFRFLVHLISNPDRAVSYDELLQAVWGYADPEMGDHKLVVNLASRLRRKLGTGIFCNVRGYGYRLRSRRVGPSTPVAGERGG